MAHDGTFSLFDSPNQYSNPFDFTTTIDDEFDEDNNLDAVLDQLDREQKIAEESRAAQEQKQSQREIWAQVIPAIVSGLTAQTSAELSRGIQNYANVLADTIARRSASKERAKARKHESRESKLAREDRERTVRERDDRLFAQQEITIANSQAFITSERKAGDIFTSETIARGVSTELRTNLIRMGYGHELSKELEALRFRHEQELIGTREQGNINIIERQIAVDQALAMTNAGIRQDLALSIATKIVGGASKAELSPEEQIAADVYEAFKKTSSQLQLAGAFSQIIGTISRTNVPLIYPEGHPKEGQPVLDSTRERAITTPMTALQFFEIFEDPSSRIEEFLNPKVDDIRREIDLESGRTVGELLNEGEAEEAIRAVESSSNSSEAIRRAASSIPNEQAAATFAVVLYEAHGLVGAKAALANLNVPARFRDMMIRAIEDADAIRQEQEERALRANSPSSGVSRPFE